VISCEHAVKDVPQDFRGLFEGHEAQLDSHRGYDAGALDLAGFLAGAYNAPCIAGRISRLLVDHNRSPHNPSLWSEFSRNLDAAEKSRLLESYYRPFRESVHSLIKAQIAAGRCLLHLSVHSFTPVFMGRERRTDVGILYDPARVDEKAFGKLWQRQLKCSRPDLRVHLNRPYRGRNDCHQSAYRSQYAPGQYLAIELEVNQRLLDPLRNWQGIKESLGSSLQGVLKTV
jgi:predicted N-formylglutamate amidohydrolase